MCRTLHLKGSGSTQVAETFPEEHVLKLVLLQNEGYSISQWFTFSYCGWAWKQVPIRIVTHYRHSSIPMSWPLQIAILLHPALHCSSVESFWQMKIFQNSLNWDLLLAWLNLTRIIPALLSELTGHFLLQPCSWMSQGQNLSQFY